MRDKDNVRPFSNGSEGHDWRSANCERCTKRGEPDANGDGPCPMETAVARGFILGTIPAALVEPYGGTLSKQEGYCSLPQQCSQFVPVMRCESIRTRNRRPCGAPATTTVESSGLRRPLCDRHLGVFLADEHASAGPMEESRP